MPYAILRFQKKKAGGVGACYAHNERKKETYKSNPDINTSRKNENYHLVLPKQTYSREARRMIAAAGCKTRKDSTVLVETLITASPEFINALTLPEQREYFKRALNFVGQKIGRDNIIATIVHNDEKTPHMHLSFCPITPDKRLSAKELLGNQAKLSRWQTEYHEVMSARWPELERGLSSIETGRKHIPVWLFKVAERLDKQAAMIEYALANINALNAKKQREQALGLLAKWLPQAERFTAQVKLIDGNIKALEQAKQEEEKRAREAENTAESKVGTVIAHMQGKIADKDKEIWEAWQEAQKLRRQIRNAEAMISKIPLDLREKLLTKTNDDRGHRQ
jgi:hypothetical protein